MICKNCNAENSDGAKFCSVCGYPLNGTICPTCGTYNPDGTAFCQQCGARLDGKRYCPKCKTELEEHDIFCPKCGTKCDEPHKDTPIETGKFPWEKFRHGMHISALAMSICLAALTIIFTIFMGCNVSSARLIGNFQNDMPTPNSVYVDLFYYFGEAWKPLDFLQSGMTAYNATEYIKPILGLLICVATIAVVLTFAIMSIVCNVKSITKGHSSGIGMSLAAFFAFVAGAVALLFLHSQSISANVLGESLTADQLALLDALTTTFNGATIAGFALGGVFLGLMIVFELISKEKVQFNKTYILNSSLSLAGALLMIIMIAMFAKPLVTFTVKYTETLRLSIGYGPYSLFGAGAAYVASKYQPNDSATVMSLSAIGLVFCYLVLLLGTIYLLKSIRSILCDEPGKKQAVYSPVILITAIANLIITILANNAYANILVESAQVSETLFSFSFVIPIVMLVMSVLVLGVEIAREVVNNSLEAKGDENISL